VKKFGFRMAVAVAACSAVSLGACWSEDANKTAKNGDGGEKSAAAVAAEKAVEATKEAASAAKEAASAAAAAVSAATKDAMAKAGDAVERAKVAAKDAANDAADAAKSAADSAKEAVNEATADKPADTTVAQAPAPAPTTPPAAQPATPPAPAPAPAAESKPDAAAAPAADGEKTFTDGRYRLANGEPTFKVTDGTVDWASWQGFRRYHDACHVCHGPNALGGSFAPNLADSLKTMSYDDFVAVVAAGRVANRGGTEYVMPALGGNKDVMCYLDDIYTYIKGRSVYETTNDPKTAIPPGRPAGREDISDEAKKSAAECIGD
jgi:methanol metabolism-related c-type cytochrome